MYFTVHGNPKGMLDFFSDFDITKLFILLNLIQIRTIVAILRCVYVKLTSASLKKKNKNKNKK